MLSNADFNRILKTENKDVVLKDIHWKTQDSHSDSLLFYRIADSQKDETLFRERIAAAQFGWLIVNRVVQDLPPHCTVIEERKWPEVQKQLLDILYPLPNLIFIGITGTNGKTTTTDLVLQLGQLIGKKGLSIGTLGVRDSKKTLQDFGLTSPSFIDLRKFLAIYGQGKDFCVMEASSHALVQDRLYGIEFDSAGWPSFSQDHLDYHHTMEEYFRAKCLIFNHLKPGAHLFVPQEQHELYEKLKAVSSKTEIAAEIHDELPLFFKTRFNQNNLEVAVAIIRDLFMQNILIDYKLLTPPDGRFYIQPYQSNYIVVDFAHTPDALENVCKGIRQTFPGYTLKVLFGCGGDRDRSKRPQMGEVVARWADEIYVTSDNPRSEDSEQIIADIIQGIKNKKFQSITERPKAVKIAFSELKEKEILLLAGKGHEDYILIKGVKHPYSDIREVDEFIARTKL